MSAIFQDIAAAFQFLTRLPLNRLVYEPDALPRAVKYFPLVGLAVGAAAAGLYCLLSTHLPIAVIALLIVLFSTLVTGGYMKTVSPMQPMHLEEDGTGNRLSKS